MTETFAANARALAGLSGAVLGWRPAEFWAATPDELATILEAFGGGAPAPPDLERLMAMFPDAKETVNG